MESVFVIGSNSFSGSDFIDLLLSDTDYRIFGTSRSLEKSQVLLKYRTNPAHSSHFIFHRLDLNHDRDKLFAMLSDIKPDYIVNFAAQSEVGPSWENPEHWFQTNAVAIAALGNFLKNKSWLRRYIHISSPEVYGNCEGIVTEDAPLNPSTPYAASKSAGDLMLFTLVKNYGFPLVMIRATNVYGPHQQLFKIIPRSVVYLKQRKTIELHGGGEAVKSYIHIRDVSRGELAAMRSGNPGEIYHLSPDNGIAVKDVVSEICAQMGMDFSKSTIHVTERPGQDKAYVIDSSRARSQFGWQPKISFSEGIREVIQWVDKYWDKIQKMPLEYQHKP